MFAETGVRQRTITIARRGRAEFTMHSLVLGTLCLSSAAMQVPATAAGSTPEIRDTAQLETPSAVLEEWNTLRDKLTRAPIGIGLTTNMPGLAFVPAPLPAHIWLEILESLDLAPGQKAWLLSSYSKYLNDLDRIYDNELRPLADRVEDLLPAYRANEGDSVRVVCEAILPQFEAIRAKLVQAEDRCFGALQAVAEADASKRELIDRFRMSHNIVSYQTPPSFLVALTRINCDYLIEQAVDGLDLPAAHRDTISQIRSNYRVDAIKLLRARASVYLRCQCATKALRHRVFDLPEERQAAISASQAPLVDVEERILRLNTSVVYDAASLLGDPESLIGSYRRSAYPHLFPDPTDLRDFVREVGIALGPEKIEWLAAIGQEVQTKRESVNRSMISAYETMAWSFTLTRGAGDEYRKYLTTLSELAARRIAIAKEVVDLVRGVAAEEPARSFLDDACERAYSNLERALSMTAFPGQAIVIELDTKEGVARMTGIPERLTVPIPRN